MRGQRHLYQNAVDGRIGVGLGDRLLQLLLRRIFRQTQGFRIDPKPVTGLFLIADIQLAGGVLPDQNHFQPGLVSLLEHLIHAFLQLRLHLRGQHFSI